MKIPSPATLSHPLVVLSPGQGVAASSLARGDEGDLLPRPSDVVVSSACFSGSSASLTMLPPRGVGGNALRVFAGVRELSSLASEASFSEVSRSVFSSLSSNFPSEKVARVKSALEGWLPSEAAAFSAAKVVFELSGGERSGVEFSGVEQSDVEFSGVEQSGVE